MAEPTYADVRAWALEQGHDLPDRRIPGAVVAAYFEAHPEATRPARTPPPRGSRGAATGANGSPPRPAPSREAGTNGTASGPPPPTDRAQQPVPATPPRDKAEEPSPEGTPPGQAREAAPAPAKAQEVPQPPATPSPGPHAEPAPAPPVRGRGLDAFAIAALVLGVIPGLSVIGIVLGVVALVRIRRSRRGGRALAILGVLAGVAWTVGIGALIAFATSNAPERAADGTVTVSGTVAVADLRVGDCPATVPGASARTVEVVPCGQPHRAEVYAAFNLDQPTFPGDSEVARFASGGCRSRLDAFVGRAMRDAFAVYFVAPEAATWRLGDREVMCLLALPGDGELPPGSAKAA